MNNLNEKDKREIIDLSLHNYPLHGRQKRFSYSVGLLLENVNELTNSNKQLFRHALLRMPLVRMEDLFICYIVFKKNYNKYNNDYIFV